MRQPSFLIPDIREMLVPEKQKELQEVLEEFHPVDIAEIVVGLTPEEQVSFFRLLAKEQQIAVFEELDQEEQSALLSSLTKEHCRELLNEMSADNRVDLLQDLPEEIAARLLSCLSESERKLTEKLLKYKPNTAGAIMTTELASVRGHMTAEQSLQLIRDTALLKETIYYLYVTDDQNHLIGILSLRDLVVAKPEQTIQDVASPYVISVTVDQDQEEVAKVMEKYDFIAVPVVDEEGRLQGIITIDDVVDVMKKESTEDIHKMAAIIPHEEEYLDVSPWSMIQKRIGWLVVFLLLEMVTGNVLRNYQTTIDAVIMLTFFIPLLIGTGGNAGTQSATLIIRGLATGELKPNRVFKIIWKEGFVGLVLGLALGCLAGLRTYWMSGDLLIASAVSCSMVATLVMATVTGSLFPILLYRLKLDPAVAAGPFIASVVDVTALLIYFGIARAILHL
jgi:magnesium transporter